MQFQPICTELRIVHLLRHNHNCSLDTSTTVTKLGRHIDVIMVRPVIPHMAGIVVGYWRNGCSLRNIAREVGLHSNTVYGIIKRFRELGNFVCGGRTRRPRKTNDRDDCVLYRLARENRRFSVRRHWAQKHINRPLGQWQHVIFCDESRFMHALPDRQSDPCLKIGWRSHE